MGVTTTILSIRATFVFAAMLIIFLVLHLLSRRQKLLWPGKQKTESLRTRYDEWPAFSSKPKYSTEWYHKNCFTKDYSETLEGIFFTQLPHWSKAEEKGCKESYAKFELLYEVRTRVSPKLVLPDAFKGRVSKWLNGDATLMANVHKQQLIHVYHPMTSEHVVYNPLRAKRPIPMRKTNLYAWVDKQAEEAGKDCDFCNVTYKTAMDDLGRHVTQHTVRMSNTFKLERWHAMVVTRFQHHPLNYTIPTFVAFFDEAWKVAHEVEAEEAAFIYPNLEWDTLYQGGMSQLHPHIHVMMSPDHYYGFMEHLRSSGQRYFEATGDNYYSVLLEVHEALGLAVHYGNSVAFPTLVGKSDMEVMFLSETPGEDFYRLIYYVVKAYHDGYTQLCKGLAAAYPAVGKSRASRLGRIPAVAKLISRGDCLSPKTDYTTMEIFQATYRNHDPWEVARKIREAIKKYD